MNRHILYIVNPISGTRAKKDLEQLIEKRTREQNIPFQIIHSVPNGDYSFLHPIIKEQKITDVVIAGGDGTVSQVINSLMDCKVNFGILPCGSGNGLAFAAKIPKNPEKALSVLFNGKPVITDGYYINNSFACMLSGLGFDAQVAHDFASQKKRGLITYIKLSLKTFFASKPYDFDITVNDKTFSIKAYFISIANSNQFGNHITIAPKASLNDGLLDIIIVKKQNKLSFVFYTLLQLGGINKLQNKEINIKKKGIIYFQTEKISINNRSSAPLHIDGEPVETPEKADISVRKKCFWLYQP